MEQELETAALASAGGLSSGHSHPVTPGEPCRNCGAPVEARYCTVCGQLAANFHRPIWSLIVTSLSDTFAFDSRLWRTLPLLLFRPGRLTRNYLDGKRVRYVPPFRLFLLSSFLFFLVVFSLGGQLGWYDDLRIAPDIDPDTVINVTGNDEISFTTQDQIDAISEALQDPDLSEAERAELEAELARSEGAIIIGDVVNEDGTIDREALREIVEARAAPDTSEEVLEQTWRTTDHAVSVYENQDRFVERFKEWTPRFSLLFLPVLALMLTTLYAWHRSKFVYDHIITSLHVQTFIFLLGTLLILLGITLPGMIGTFWLAGFLIVPVYLYRQLRVTYDTGRFMSVIRTFVVYFGGMLALSLIALGLVVASFFLT